MPKLYTTMLLILLVLWTLAAPPPPCQGGQKSVFRTLRHKAAGDTLSLQINRLRMTLNKTGSLDFETGYGAAWFDSSDPFPPILFDCGIWVLGKVNGQVGAGIVQWGSSYSPGPIINGRPAMQGRPQDSLRYRLYKITNGDNPQSSPAYANWPADMGAPVDANGKPQISVDKTVRN